MFNLHTAGKNNQFTRSQRPNICYPVQKLAPSPSTSSTTALFKPAPLTGSSGCSKPRHSKRPSASVIMTLNCAGRLQCKPVGRWCQPAAPWRQATCAQAPAPSRWLCRAAGAGATGAADLWPAVTGAAPPGRKTMHADTIAPDDGFLQALDGGRCRRPLAECRGPGGCHRPPPPPRGRPPVPSASS